MMNAAAFSRIMRELSAVALNREQLLRFNILT
jgi:hypothetical protein